MFGKTVRKLKVVFLVVKPAKLGRAISGKPVVLRHGSAALMMLKPTPYCLVPVTRHLGTRTCAQATTCFHRHA